MQFADAATIAFRDPGTRHREGNIQFKYLLCGAAGSPQNYELSVVRTEARFHGPPHRHNFDQLRYVLSGTFGEPGRLELRPGEVGYYPEGTPYQIDSGDSEVLLLQFGGASGQGFTHYEALRSHYPLLAQLGEFKDGIFRWHQQPAGKPKQQDGYEALWELIHGRPLVYPRPRYRQPVLMNPEAFDWLPHGHGLDARELGRFTERGIAVSQLRAMPGATARLHAGVTIRLVYVLEGAGRIGDREVHPGCAIELLVGTTVPVVAASALQLLAFDLPSFAPGSKAAVAPRSSTPQLHRH